MQPWESPFFELAATPQWALEWTEGRLVASNQASKTAQSLISASQAVWSNLRAEASLNTQSWPRLVGQYWLTPWPDALAPTHLLCAAQYNQGTSVDQPTLQYAQQQNQRYQAILDGISSTAVYGYDAAGTIVYWSAACETLYGIPAEEAIGLCVEAVVQPVEHADSHNAARRTAMEKEHAMAASEYAVQRWDGKVVEVYSTQVVISNMNGAPEWFAFDLDLTELRHLERTLHATNQRLASIFDLAPAAMAVATDHIFTEVNQHWLNLFGFERADVIGQHAESIGYWINLNARAQMYADLARDGQIIARDMLFRKQNGEEIECALTARMLESEGKRVVVTSIVDISELRQTQRALEVLNHELEERVSARTTDLETAIDNLRHAKDELVRSEKLAALGSMVAGIAHELNTPIGNSVTVASTLQDRSRELRHMLNGGGLRKSQLENYAETVQNSSDLLLRNLNQARSLMNSFKQVAMDQASVQRRQFDLKLTLEEVLVTARPMYKKTPHQLEVEIQEGVMMQSYPGPLGQIVTNFIANALLHAFEGRTTEHPGHMYLRCAQINDEQVELVFRDDGQGVKPEYLSRLFDPFFTTKLGKGGNGLGLNIVYNLVTQVLGGKISAHSEVGQGTCFTLILPVIAPQAKSPITSEHAHNEVANHVNE